jgi:hypothetical protein
MTSSMLLSRLIFAALATLLLCAPAIQPATAAAGVFLSEMEDLPLPPGLSETPGGVVFDSPTGRIVEAAAQGEISADQVLAFYAQTLPELGWQKIGAAAYRRDNELLKIQMEADHRPLLVRFSVVPH